MKEELRTERINKMTGKRKEELKIGRMNKKIENEK
jgi:hypothetical protein